MKTTIKALFSLLLVATLSSTFAFGQIRIDWQQCYGSLDYDVGYGIQPFGNGYRVLGTASDASGQVSCGFYHGAWMFDLNSSISIVRHKCRDYAMPSGLLRNSEGETFAVGIAYPSMVLKLWVSKLDETGNDVWSSYLGTEESLGYVTPYAAATNEGGVVAAVSVTEATGNVTTHYGGSDCWVVKLDADGNVEWECSLGTAGNETPRCLVNMRNGGILVGLTSPQIGVGNIGCGHHEDASILVKLNANGDILRSFCFPGFVVADVLELSDGYLLAGYASGNCVLVKCDFYGEVLWTRSYGGSGSESVVRVFEDGPDGYTVFANTTSLDGDVASAANLGVNGDEAGNIWVFHVDSQGDLVWERCLGSSLGLEEKVADVVKADAGEFLLVGNMTWFAEESSGDIHCTNSSLIPNSATNIYVLKVTDEYDYTAITEQAEKSVSILPNPASGSVTVTGDSLRKVEIHNLLGQLVACANINSDSITIDLSGLTRGVYLVTATDRNGRQHARKLAVGN